MTELRPSQVTVIVDTREQVPFTEFHPRPDQAPMKFITKELVGKKSRLKTGDYSVLGIEDEVRVERKRVGELAACMAQRDKRDTFKAELERLMAFPQRLVVIEGSFSDFSGGNYRSDLHVNSAVNTLMSWSGEFQIGFFPAGSRALAQWAASSYLFHAARRFHEKIERMYRGAQALAPGEALARAEEG